MHIRRSVLEKRMNRIYESHDRGWKLIETRISEDLAKRNRNMAIHLIFAVAFGLIIVILGIVGFCGIIIGLPVWPLR